jgi:hypothetical protein
MYVLVCHAQVVHISAGFAALAIAMYMGRHHETDEERHAQVELDRQNAAIAAGQRAVHPEPRAPNAPFVLLGTGPSPPFPFPHHPFICHFGLPFVDGTHVPNPHRSLMGWLDGIQRWLWISFGINELTSVIWTIWI